MENRNFKKALPYLASAVICGVVLISAGSVFGNNPEVNPPGLGVNPTFTGLTVNGPVVTNGPLTTTGTLTVNGDANIGRGDIQLIDKSIIFWDRDGEDIHGQLSGNTMNPNTPNAKKVLQLSGNLRLINPGSLITSGSVSAGSVGKFYRSRSTLMTVGTNANLAAQISACPVGTTISCSVQPTAVGALLRNYNGLGVQPTINANGINGCQASVYNSGVVVGLVQLYVWNVCFDPTGAYPAAGYEFLTP